MDFELNPDEIINISISRSGGTGRGELGAGSYGVIWPSGKKEVLRGSDIEDALVRAGYNPDTKLPELQEYYDLGNPQHLRMWREFHQ